MASEEDNFDIDIYGDGEGEQPHEGAGENYKQDDEQDLTSDHPNVTSDNQADTEVENGHTNDHATNTNAPSKPQNTLDTSSNLQPHDPKQTPQQQGVKRKGSSDDRPVDPGATSALLISDLHWWSTEDDVRGWANQAGCEDELKDVTFSEHKVNGKSKGQAFVEFASPQAASVTKHTVDSLATAAPNARKHTVVYTNHLQNPFKTLPKDAPARAKEERPHRTASQGSYNSPQQQSSYNAGNQGFRGGRGGYSNRGGYNNNRGAFNQNQGFPNPIGAGFNSPMAGGFQSNMGGGMNSFGGFNNRGGMMNNNIRGGPGGMRGGRGGMNGMMPMGGMGMNGMNMGAMNPLMAGMGMQGQGFQGGNAHFNPAFFQGNNPAAAGGDWNPHGAKRTRQE